MQRREPTLQARFIHFTDSIHPNLKGGVVFFQPRLVKHDRALAFFERREEDWRRKARVEHGNEMGYR
jgi:hypothetical protein